jgi:hypothetical protein
MAYHGTIFNSRANDRPCLLVRPDYALEIFIRPHTCAVSSPHKSFLTLQEKLVVVVALVTTFCDPMKAIAIEFALEGGHASVRKVHWRNVLHKLTSRGLWTAKVHTFDKKEKMCSWLFFSASLSIR